MFKTQGAKFPPLFSPTSFSLKDMYALSRVGSGVGVGGCRAWSCTSLEMYHTCLTEVICKQKKSQSENMLLCHGTAPPASVCHEHASLPSKSIFKQHCQKKKKRFFLWKCSKQFSILHIFEWFDYWTINVLSALPQTLILCPRASFCGWWRDGLYKDIIPHGCNAEGKKQGRRYSPINGESLAPSGHKYKEQHIECHWLD